MENLKRFLRQGFDEANKLIVTGESVERLVSVKDAFRSAYALAEQIESVLLAVKKEKNSGKEVDDDGGQDNR
ncbi:MAG: hypothetical protein IJ955_10345 [Oscillospiraceae bacterium]|nr:hypothetical protein [Oscillospiraceae bacterium]